MKLFVLFKLCKSITLKIMDLSTSPDVYTILVSVNLKRSLMIPMLEPGAYVSFAGYLEKKIPILKTFFQICMETHPEPQ